MATLGLGTPLLFLYGARRTSSSSKPLFYFLAVCSGLLIVSTALVTFFAPGSFAFFLVFFLTAFSTIGAGNVIDAVFPPEPPDATAQPVPPSRTRKPERVPEAPPSRTRKPERVPEAPPSHTRKPERVPASEPYAAASLQDAVALAELRRTNRRQARKVAERDPALARELRIGRPDLRRGYDDGGLIDVNNVPAHVLARLPGITPELFSRLARARDELGGFTSAEEMSAAADLPPHLTEQLAEYGLFNLGA